MKDNDTDINNIPSIIAGIMLLLALLPIWPYGYYQILRWVVTGTSVYNVYVMYKVKRKIWLSIMIAIVVLFNPIVPIYLTRSIWIFLDLITAILMFTFSITLIKSRSKTKYMSTIKTKIQALAETYSVNLKKKMRNGDQ